MRLLGAGVASLACCLGGTNRWRQPPSQSWSVCEEQAFPTLTTLLRMGARGASTARRRWQHVPLTAVSCAVKSCVPQTRWGKATVEITEHMCLLGR